MLPFNEMDTSTFFFASTSTLFNLTKMPTFLFVPSSKLILFFLFFFFLRVSIEKESCEPFVVVGDMTGYSQLLVVMTFLHVASDLVMLL
jgi:hypothetical protein